MEDVRNWIKKLLFFIDLTGVEEESIWHGEG